MNNSPKFHNKAAKFLRITAITVIILLVIYLALSIFGAIAAMELPRKPLDGSTPASFGLDYEDAVFPSRGDGIELRGWFIPSSGDSVIIVVHGGAENRVDHVVDTLALAHDLSQKGFGISFSTFGEEASQRVRAAPYRTSTPM
jgi:uncharacterized protein